RWSSFEISTAPAKSASAANLRSSGSSIASKVLGYVSPPYSDPGVKRSSNSAQSSGGICSMILRVSSRVASFHTRASRPSRTARMIAAALLDGLNPAATKMLVSSTTRVMGMAVCFLTRTPLAMVACDLRHPPLGSDLDKTVFLIRVVAPTHPAEPPPDRQLMAVPTARRAATQSRRGWVVGATALTHADGAGLRGKPLNPA